MKNTFRSSILSGVAVAIAGWGYLAFPNIIGAVLFSFGLLTVVNYKLKLYTGTAGFVPLRYEDGRSRWVKAIGELLFILFGNICGCLLVSLLTRMSPIELGESAQRILESRLAIGPLRAGLLAIGCGFIMTTVVTFAREGKPLALLFGVPLFINCGLVSLQHTMCFAHHQNCGSNYKKQWCSLRNRKYIAIHTVDNSPNSNRLSFVHLLP